MCSCARSFGLPAHGVKSSNVVVLAKHASELVSAMDYLAKAFSSDLKSAWESGNNLQRQLYFST